MAATERVIRSRRVVLPEGMRPAAIRMRDGRIVSVEADDTAGAEDFDELVIMPGLVDTHVHINEPGRTEWEGFATATEAAAAGGVTTLIEMPLNSIPATVSAKAYAEKVAAAEGKCSVDVGFWGGVIPGNAGEIGPLWEAGCFGFKCFLSPSGVEEFPNVGEADLRLAMPKIAACGGVLLVHAEDPAELRAHCGDLRSYAAYLGSRPRRAEDSAIALLIRLASETKCRVHIVHLSSSDSLPQLRAARAAGVPITVETCPHYLTFEAKRIANGATEFKCAPPIREAENRELLWRALVDGQIDLVASDHSPCPPAMKLKETGDFFAAWGGIASLELGLAAVWTEAQRHEATVEDLARWMSRAPAQLAGLGDRKGTLATGYDADMVVWDPDAVFTVDATRLRQRHKLTPYAGCKLRGVVRKTILRGEDVKPGGPPTGRILQRQPL
jgi:allantoinase